MYNASGQGGLPDDGYDAYNSYWRNNGLQSRFGARGPEAHASTDVFMGSSTTGSDSVSTLSSWSASYSQQRPSSAVSSTNYQSSGAFRFGSPSQSMRQPQLSESQSPLKPQSTYGSHYQSNAASSSSSPSPSEPYDQSYAYSYQHAQSYSSSSSYSYPYDAPTDPKPYNYNSTYPYNTYPYATSQTSSSSSYPYYLHSQQSTSYAPNPYYENPTYQNGSSGTYAPNYGVNYAYPHQSNQSPPPARAYSPPEPAPAKKRPKRATPANWSDDEFDLSDIETIDFSNEAHSSTTSAPSGKGNNATAIPPSPDNFSSLPFTRRTNLTPPVQPVQPRVPPIATPPSQTTSQIQINVPEPTLSLDKILAKTNLSSESQSKDLNSKTAKKKDSPSSTSKTSRKRPLSSENEDDILTASLSKSKGRVSARSYAARPSPKKRVDTLISDTVSNASSSSASESGTKKLQSSRISSCSSLSDLVTRNSPVILPPAPPSLDQNTAPVPVTVSYNHNQLQIPLTGHSKQININVQEGSGSGPGPPPRTPSTSQNQPCPSPEPMEEDVNFDIRIRNDIFEEEEDDSAGDALSS